MRTFRYAKEFPDGIIFDTEPNRPDPLLPHDWKSRGWVENPSELRVSQDDMIAALVKRELANQASDRDKLDKEFIHKTGDIPHFAAKEKTLIAVLDDNHAKERKRR